MLKMPMDRFSEKLDVLKKKGRFRTLDCPKGIDLSSNDYLGLSAHPALRAAAISFLQMGGDIGSAGSRLLRGHTQTHEQLEEFSARFFAAEKTLFFSCGFQANMALFTALPGRHDTVIFDAYIHASARDGVQAGHAQHIRVPHNDVQAYEEALRRAAMRGGQIWIAVESVYSMDGDKAPLEELYALAVQYDAVLVVDEAHATGVFGTGGRGRAFALVQRHGYERIITLHTCGKAVGVAGGLVCGRAEIIDYLVNAARPFIYSTAPMPLQAFLVQKSLELIDGDEGRIRREELQNLCVLAQKLFGGAGTQIIPLLVGDEIHAVNIAQKMQQSGYDIRAIRPPSVPEGTARLRLSLSAKLDIEALKKVSELWQGFILERAA
ncbi:MAG: 8-amino-7-oxononanoate synthase [Alphaproteobacteria bacterium]|nr:8-amino-7-oxononanoate synthase [Alphaproteobacteria bacterium]